MEGPATIASPGPASFAGSMRPGSFTVMPAPPAESIPPDAIIDGLAPEEQVFAMIDEAALRWTGDLQTWLDGQPDGGAVVLEDSHSAVAVTWFGEPSPELLEMLASAPEGVSTRVRSAAFRADELEALVPLGMRDRTGDGLAVSSGWPAADGSGVGFGVEELPSGATLDDAAAILAERIGRDDVPIHVEVTGPIVPAAG